MNPVRILIADDHPLFRFGIGALLATMEDIEVVGEAATGEEAVSLALQLKPDVILMDVRMPGLNGIEATRQILAETPETRILMVTMFEDDASVFTAMRAGARGYVLKDADKGEIVRAIRAVASGEAIFSASVAAKLIDFFAQPSSVLKGAFPSLTERERDILHLIARGQNNTQISRALSLSPKTISNYVSSIFGKLQVADRAEAIVRAREAGLT